VAEQNKLHILFYTSKTVASIRIACGRKELLLKLVESALTLLRLLSKAVVPC